MLVGYITGVAVVLILGQLGKLLGISSDEDDAIRETIDILRHLGDANGVTVVVGALSIAFLVVAGRVNNRIPGALILVVAGIAASWALDLAGQGVSITGPVPSGLPGLEVPDLSRGDVGSLVLPALAVFLVAFSDSILISRSFAARHHEVVDANQELLAFGVAQIAAGVTQGIPVGTSGSRTAVNDDMGATSQVSGLVAAGTIAAILMFLTGPIQYLPSAVLGRDHRVCRGQADRPRPVAGPDSQQQGRGGDRRHHRRVCRHWSECCRRSSWPWCCRWPTSSAAQHAPRTPCSAGLPPRTGTSTSSSTLMPASPRGWSSTASRTGSSSPTPTSSSAGSGPRWTARPSPCGTSCSTASFISDIDASAEEALREVIDGLRERNIELHLARATLELRERLDAVGLVDTIGTDHFHGTVTAAVDACRPRADGSS